MEKLHITVNDLLYEKYHLSPKLNEVLKLIGDYHNESNSQEKEEKRKIAYAEKEHFKSLISNSNTIVTDIDLLDQLINDENCFRDFCNKDN